MMIFTPLISYSFIASKMIPHINVDLLSGASLILAYQFGPWIALIYTVFAGMFALYKSSFIRFLLIVRIVFVALIDFVLAFYAHTMNFNTFFIVGILAQNIILFFVYLVLDPDPIQNYTHRATHLFSNLLILRFVFIALNNLVGKI